MSADWINTFTGRKFYPLDPRVEDIHIEDIAHALSLQCRFTGHVQYFYSVAQHSVHVAEHVSAKDRLWALLHDAPEAYLIDLARPVKHAPALAGYRRAEVALMKAICRRFGLSPKMPAPVKEADNRMLITEAHSLMTMHDDWLNECPYQPYKQTVVSMLPGACEERFLSLFRRLTNADLAPVSD